MEKVCSAVNWMKIQNGWGAVNGGEGASHFLCSCFSFCKEDNHAKCVIVSQMTPAWICSLQELDTPSIRGGCDAPTLASLLPVNCLSLLASYFVSFARKLHQLGALFNIHIFERLLHFPISTECFHSVAFHAGYFE